MLHTSPCKYEEHQMQQQEQPCWWPTRRQFLWTLAIVAVLIVAVLIGYRYGITLWDWIKLLIVPAVIAGGGLWYNRQQRERELEIADRRAQDEALQAYLDQIGQLLLDKARPLRQSKERDEVRTLARARTLTILARLDGLRKGSAIQFLYESGLIVTDADIVDLKGADLKGTNLKGSVLKRTKLSRVDLSGADFDRAALSDANLFGADLKGVNLRRASLFKANLSGADLSGADLRSADLSEADLYGANLIEADLRGANLSGADLSRANMRNAYATKSNLRNTKLNLADLKGVNLSGISLSKANLSGADLKGST
jgi:uncharacterized protein YjbI with pentapeptide repeats